MTARRDQNDEEEESKLDIRFATERIQEETDSEQDSEECENDNGPSSSQESGNQEEKKKSDYYESLFNNLF